MEEQTITPPPSFRALRVRHRQHARPTTALVNATATGENAESTPTANGHARGYPQHYPHPELSSSTSRGRSRTRGPKTGVATMQSAPVPSRVRPPLRLAMPSSSSLPTSADHSPNDDELLFEMSPIHAHSPTGITVFESIHATATSSTSGRHRVMDSRALEKKSMHTLASLWENSQKNTVSREEKLTLTRPHLQAHSISMPLATLATTTASSHAKLGMLSKHHRRGHSDLVAGKHGSRSKHDRTQVPMHQRPEYGIKTLLDLSPLLSVPTPGEPSSPDEDEPFLYSFPTFNSSPLEKARKERARREDGRKFVRHERNPSTDSLASYKEQRPNRGRAYMRTEDDEADTKRSENEDPRELRLEPGPDPMLVNESQLRYEDDDVNVVSHAFRSVSLETGKDTTEDDEDDETDDAYFSSQPCSSSASSSVLDDLESLERMERSRGELDSMLANFPDAPSQIRSHSRSESYSRSGSRRFPSRDRRHKGRPGDGEKGPDMSAFVKRGRPSVARARMAEAVPCDESNAHMLLVTGERRVRGRTPAPRWRAERCLSPSYMT